MPQGDQRSVELDLSDLTYDGHMIANVLHGGLGQLTDGEEGNSNFRQDQHGLGIRGYDWVGWKSDAFPSEQSKIEITFKFDALRNFSSVQLFCNNQFSKEVRVFSRAEAWFSQDGTSYADNHVKYQYERDTLMELARVVIIPLNRRIGRYVKLVLYFDARWMMISGIHFESGKRFPDYCFPT